MMNRILVGICICVGMLILLKMYEVFMRHKGVSKEGYIDAAEYKWIYDTVDGIELKSSDAKTLPNTENITACQKSCTLDSKCRAWTYDGVSKDCQLLPVVQEIESLISSNTTTRSAFRMRPTLNDEKKYKEFLNTKLPNTGDGAISTHNNVKSLQDCAMLCSAATATVSATPKQQCIAFAYDYDHETCQVNSSIKGALESDFGKVTYLVR